LEAAEGGTKGECEGASEHGLGDSGDVLDEEVAVGEEGSNGESDGLALADDDAFDVGGEAGGDISSGWHEVRIRQGAGKSCLPGRSETGQERRSHLTNCRGVGVWFPRGACGGMKWHREQVKEFMRTLEAGLR